MYSNYPFSICSKATVWKNQKIRSHRKIFRETNLLATSLVNALLSRNLYKKKRDSNTVWKYDFFVTDILREINFGVSRSEKSALLTHLESLNFDFS